MGLDALVTIIAGRARPSAWLEAVRRVLNGLIEGARSGAAVATVIAVIGVLIEVLTVTGFAQKLSFFMLDLSDGSLFTLSIVVALSCLVFGLGLPTSASYFIVALFGAPALVELGVPLLAAHMFVFYFANLSAITPPSRSRRWLEPTLPRRSSGRPRCRLYASACRDFCCRVLFLFEPQILGLQGHVGHQLVAVGQALIATAALNFAIEGRLFGRISWPERIILFIAAFGLIYWVTWVELVSLAFIIAIAARNYLSGRAAVAGSEA